MDLSVSLSNGKLYADLHIKAADCHQYVEYTSFDPDHTKKSIIYSQAFRLSSFVQLKKVLNVIKATTALVKLSVRTYTYCI